MGLKSDAECLKLLHDLQKTSRTVLTQIEKLETLLRPLIAEIPATERQLLEFANSDHDELVLMLLVSANRFGKLTRFGHCGFKPTLPDTSLEDLRVLRNLWEHRDEKPMQSNGKWRETRADNQKWLRECYGENWALAYSLSVGAIEVKIGGRLSLSALKVEANYWLDPKKRSPNT